MKIKIKKLHENAILPSRATEDAVGYDLYALENTIVLPGETKLVKTGISIQIDSAEFTSIKEQSVFMAVVPRSGMSLKTKLRQANCFGVVDPDYRGEVCGIIENIGDKPAEIKAGERFAQALFIPVYLPELQLVEDLTETTRGPSGFGSTGK
jgi:dUTP pyrophosphatase